MSEIVPFSCIRPSCNEVAVQSTMPVDTFSDQEVVEELRTNPRSFMHLAAAAMEFPGTADWRPDAGVEAAQSLIAEMLSDGSLIDDQEPSYYLYMMVLPNGKSQTGVVGCLSIDEYEKNAVKKHEDTRTDKEDGVIRHVEACGAQTAALFLAYRGCESRVPAIVESIVTRDAPIYDFVLTGIRNAVWTVSDPDDVNELKVALAQIPELFIADGHHRSAAARRSGIAARRAALESGSLAAGEKLPSDYVMSIVFPDDQLTVFEYNRSVSDLGGLTPDEFLAKVGEEFTVTGPLPGRIKPERRGIMGMYLGGSWYRLEYTRAELEESLVDRLDVSILQNRLLDPILGIKDPRTDKRLDFVRGTRPIEDLENRVINGEPAAVSFLLYPTDIQDLFAVADEGGLMPPKSTWFSPKARCGLFIYRV